MPYILLADTSAGGLLDGFGINTIAFLSQLVSFGIVFLILWKWAFPAVLSTIEKRNALIQEGINNAEQAKKDLAEAATRAERVLADAGVQAQATIERATKIAQQEANRIIEDAQARAEQISQRQIARVQQEANRARNELSRLVVDLSIDAASKVISKSVNTKENRRLVEEFVAASGQARNN